MSQVQRLELRALRRDNPPGAADGGCGEFLNLRYRQNTYQVVGPKVQLYAKPDFKESFIHKQDDYEHWLGFRPADNGIYLYDPATMAETLIGTVNGEFYDFRSLKNYLIVTTSTKLMIWLWEEDAYTLIDTSALDKLINVELTADPDEITEPDFPESDQDYARAATNDGMVDEDARPLMAQELLGYYYKQLAAISAKGHIHGGIAWRVAVRLFDGSYIYHTSPRFFLPYGYPQVVAKKKGNDWYGMRFAMGGAGVLAKAVIGSAAFDSLKTIASSVEIFFSKAALPFNINSDTVTTDYINDVYVDLLRDHPSDWENYGDPIRDYFEISDDFKKLADTPLFYKVGTVNFDDMVQNGGNYEGDFKMDLVDFYSNYGPRKTLTVGGYSQYGISARVSYVYNSRLILGDISQTLTGGRVFNSLTRYGNNLSPQVSGETQYNFRAKVDVRTVVSIKTDGGVRKAVYTIPKTDPYAINEYQSSTNANKRAIILDGMTGFYDDRATNLDIYVSLDDQQTWIKVASLALTPSDYANYAYYSKTDFLKELDHTPYDPQLDGLRKFWANWSGITIDYLASTTPSVPPSTDATNNDANLRIISEVTNPFVFETANYQEVSTGAILAFGSNTDPLSQSQFGVYPLYTMTDQGIWAGSIGTGSVFITSDVPVNGEVILNRRAKIDLSVGMVYAAAGGLRYLSGRQPEDVSGPVEGIPDFDLINSSDMALILNNSVLGDYRPYVDNVPFREYLEGAVLGSGINRETNVNGDVFVANPAYDYMYVFDPSSTLWYKIPGKVSSFINNYPKLYAMGDTHILNMSEEQDNANSPVVIITRPLSLQGDELFKKIRRTFMRCMLKTAGNSHCALVRLGSDDLVNWTIDTGNDGNAGVFKDVWMTHSFDSKRYIVYVFIGTINVGLQYVNYIKGLDIEFDFKWNNKLR